MSREAYYPLFADLRGRRCLVVGGGPVAQRKVTTLLSYGAQVTVVSPDVTGRLAASARRGTIRHVARRFRPPDLNGAWLAFAATDDERINEAVSRHATARRIFTNVVDQKPLCSFIAPAIARRGGLVLAVSTGGGSPALAKQLRSDLARTLGTDYARMLRLLKSLRASAKQRLPAYQDRKRYFDRLVAGRVFDLIRRGRTASARREALALLARAAGNGA
ncbi:MAG: bifunctional precorrin-2 dehydrogenase/sirohydrochlorin ferrochelatase [Candidatus Omnitrophica bacterium]|nr:bifunctional precorrin-2 dehydrogenase/sirohydrochlorin ferrochelatase [Candidatus Omnitrophota bacterium]